MNFIEPLEPRIAPAVIVSPVDSKGVLHIMHDDASGTAEHIVVTETSANSFKIEDTLLMTPLIGTFDHVKSIAIVTSTFDDTIDLKFSHDGLAGNLDITTGGGKNAITLESVDFISGVIAGKVTIRGGAGDDTVNMTKGYFAKNLNLALGNGVNELARPVGSDNAFVGSTFKYIGGGGMDTLDLDNLVAGNINVVLGDGNNGVTGTARIIGKSASFTGGSGADTISISLGSTGGSLSAKLGAGADSFTFLGGALASAKLDGGADADTLAGLMLLPAKQKIAGFETES